MPKVAAKYILKKLGEGALKKVGGKILEGVLPGVFGKSDDFKKLKKELKVLSKKLDDILLLTRSTFELVQSLPDVITFIVDEQTLYLAKTNLESSMSVYLLLEVPPNIISQNELTQLTQSFTILIDKEHKTEVITRLPNYGEYLLMATSGKMFDLVYSNIVSKFNKISNSRAQIGKTLAQLGKEAESIIASEYISSGFLYDKSPWLTWGIAPDRFVNEQICVPVCLPSAANGGCWTECSNHTSPNNAWNNARNAKAKRLDAIRDEIGMLAKTYMSLTVCEEVLSTYRKSLETRKVSIISKQTGFYALAGNLIPFEYREGFSLSNF